MLVAYVAMRASRKLHEGALCGVSGSPVAFFDVTPLGRIINRFSSDLQAVLHPPWPHLLWPHSPWLHSPWPHLPWPHLLWLHPPWLHTHHVHQVDVQLRASTQMLFMSAFAILGALSAMVRVRVRVMVSGEG